MQEQGKEMLESFALVCCFKAKGEGVDGTDDLLITNQLLYQLSYVGAPRLHVPCGIVSRLRLRVKKVREQHPGKTKRPPGNRAASSLGRIVPTEAKPSELSGEILWLPPEGVKAKSGFR
jgi:hypothetical protein